MEHQVSVGEGGTFDDGFTTLDQTVGFTTVDHTNTCLDTERGDDELDRESTTLEDDDDGDSSTFPSWFTDHESLSLSEARSEISTPLYEALEEGNYEAVIRFLKTGQFFPFSFFPFTLLQRQFGSEIGSPEEQAATWVTKHLDRHLPLHLAVSNRAPLEVVELLVHSYPKGVQQTDLRGNLPLHLAIMNNCHRQVIAFLLRTHPASIETENEAGMNPLACVEKIEDPDDRQRGEVIRLYVEGTYLLGQEIICPLKQDMKELGNQLEVAKSELRLAQLEFQVEKDHLVQFEGNKGEEDRRMRLEVAKMKSELPELRDEKERLRAEKTCSRKRIVVVPSDDAMSNTTGWIDSEMTRIVSELNNNTPLPPNAKRELVPSPRSQGRKPFRLEYPMKTGSGAQKEQRMKRDTRNSCDSQENLGRPCISDFDATSTIDSSSYEENAHAEEGEFASELGEPDSVYHERRPNNVATHDVDTSFSNNVFEHAKTQRESIDKSREQTLWENHDRIGMCNPLDKGMTGKWQGARDNNCISLVASGDERDEVSYGRHAHPSVPDDCPNGRSEAWQPKNYKTREASAAEVRREGPMDELIKMVRSESVEKIPDSVCMYVSGSQSHSRVWEQEGFIDEYFEGNPNLGEQVLRYHYDKMAGANTSFEAGYPWNYQQY